MRYVVIEGLPAAGKSEVLELLARFYPDRVRVFPELVKEIVLDRCLDLFADRAQLTEAIQLALPERHAAIREAIDAGFLCLEESHLGVHYAYAVALGDETFGEGCAEPSAAAPRPDAVLRLDIPLSRSVERQAARGTSRFDVDAATLTSMLARLDRWHADHGVSPVRVDADRPAHAVIEALEDLLGLTYGAPDDVLDQTLDVLLLLGRPASGKSEFIDFFTRCPVDERARTYRIAPFHVLDDFPILWEKFEEDDIWENLGRGRLYSKRCSGNYSVNDDALWPFLIERINAKAEDLLEPPAALKHGTLIIEFSRGGSTGYADALARLSSRILERATALYVSVSFEESWRRNIARYDEKARDGILTHSVPREEMERTYGTDDWFSLTDGGCGVLDAGGFSLPYATLPNEPESVDPIVLGDRYRAALDPLYRTWRGRLAA
ncbi:hypothetical protein ACFLR0_02075 [Candidatus Bipolaricaulota bacterium]